MKIQAKIRRNINIFTEKAIPSAEKYKVQMLCVQQ